MRIVAVVAVITKDEIFPFFHYCRWQGIVWLLFDITLFKLYPVDIHCTVFYFHLITRDGNETFDEVGFIILGWLEDDDISSFRGVKFVADFVNQQSLPLLKRWFHTAADNNESLEGGLQDEENK